MNLKDLSPLPKRELENSLLHPAEDGFVSNGHKVAPSPFFLGAGAFIKWPREPSKLRVPVTERSAGASPRTKPRHQFLLGMLTMVLEKSGTSDSGRVEKRQWVMGDDVIMGNLDLT